MKFAVVQLRERGRRLNKEEITLASVAIGDLLVSDWKEGNASRRALRMAEVVEHYAGIKRGLLVTLFDPSIVRMEERWFVLKGFQMDSASGSIIEYSQEWLVRPVTPAIESAMPEPIRAVRFPHESAG